MKLEQLKVMQAVVESGSVKSASELLHKTQPAISQALKTMEFQSGVTMFDRSGYRLVLTPIGERVYLQSLRVLEETNDLSQLIKHFGKGNEEKIIFTIDALTDINILMPALDVVKKEYPETRVILNTEILSGTIQAVEEGVANLAVAPIIPVLLEEKGFDYIPLNKTLMRNVAAPSLSKDFERTEKITDLKKYHQIVVIDSGIPEGLFDREFGVQKGQRRWYVADLHMKKKLLKAGIGWGRLPEHLISNEISKGELVEIELPHTHLTLDLNFFLFRRNTPIIGPVASTLWNSFKQQVETK